MNDLEPLAPGPPPAPGAVYPRRYGQQVGGTHPTGMHCSFYQPQRSWVKVIFSQACVKISVHMGEGVCLSACWDTPQSRPLGAYTPREQTPPRSDSPWEHTPSPESRLQHTVNEWLVYILLECILVYNIVRHLNIFYIPDNS